MASGNPNIAELGKGTQFQPGQSGNPAGMKKGTKHLSTWIQELMNADADKLVTKYLDENGKLKKFEGGPPAMAIIYTAMTQAARGDVRWADWLARHGWKDVPEEDPDDNPVEFHNFVPTEPEEDAPAPNTEGPEDPLPNPRIDDDEGGAEA